MGEHSDDLADFRIHALERQITELQRQVRFHEDELDTFVRTVWWRRWLFVIDGWSGHLIVKSPKWRPWRRWWRS